MTSVINKNFLYQKTYKHFLKGKCEKALSLLSEDNLEKEKDADAWMLKAQLLILTEKKWWSNCMYSKSNWHTTIEICRWSFYYGMGAWGVR